MLSKVFLPKNKKCLLSSFGLMTVQFKQELNVKLKVGVIETELEEGQEANFFV